MQHFFEYTHGIKHYFVWDVESGSLATLSYPAFLVAKYTNDNLTESERKDFDAISPSLQEEIRSELSESGLLEPTEAEVYEPHFNGDIKAMCLHICHDCNLRCEYCFASGGTYNTPRYYMTEEVGIKAIDFLIAHSGKRRNLEIDFFGGEPLMNMDVVKAIVSYARTKEKDCGKHFSFTMTTNALLLDEANRNWLNDEMDNVVISIDGRPEVHNACRKTRNGKECYDLIMNNAREFRHIRGNKRYYIRGTFTKRNLDFASDVLYLNDCGFDQLSVEPVVLPEGSPLAIEEKDLPAICAEYDKLADGLLDRFGSDKQFNFFHFMIDLNRGPCVLKRAVGCGAGNEYVAVAPTGDIYPCHQFAGETDYKMGDVFSGEFNRDLQARFQGVNLYTKEGCTDCWAKYYCSGGCVANSVHFNHDMNKPYKMACTMLQKRLELSLAISYLSSMAE